MPESLRRASGITLQRCPGEQSSPVGASLRWTKLELYPTGAQLFKCNCVSTDSLTLAALIVPRVCHAARHEMSKVQRRAELALAARRQSEPRSLGSVSRGVTFCCRTILAAQVAI